MKIRTGFVSNSSSSSFTCQVSGITLAGWDGEYEEPTAECVCGHEFLAEYLLPGEEIERDLSLEGKRADLNQIFRHDDVKLKMLESAGDDVIEELYKDHEDAINDLYEPESSGYDLPSERCPLCQLKEIAQDDLVAYLLKKYVGGNQEKVLKEIRQEFGDYKSFRQYIT